MKLAILAESWLYDENVRVNGTLIQLHNLAKAFAQRGIQVHYVAAANVNHNLAEGFDGDIYFHRFNLISSIFGFRRKIGYYTKKIQEINPDALYVRGRNVMQYAAGRYAKKYNKIFVWGTNGDDGVEYWKNVKRLKISHKNPFKKLLLFPINFIEDLYINKGMNMAGFIVNQSDLQKKRTKVIMDREGILLPSYFQPVKDLFLKEKLILWFATLSPNKQPELFIDLIKNTNLKGWKAIMVGGTSKKIYEDKIRKLTAGTHIHLEGTVPFCDSFSYFQKASIFINTSIKEGLSNTFIQSWLSAAPVLSLNHDPNDWLTDKNIGFCAHGNVELLGKKLQDLIENSQQIKIMGQNSKTFAEKTFSDEAIIDSYLRIFEGKV